MKYILFVILGTFLPLVRLLQKIQTRIKKPTAVQFALEIYRVSNDLQNILPVDYPRQTLLMKDYAPKLRIQATIVYLAIDGLHLSASESTSYHLAFPYVANSKINS